MARKGCSEAAAYPPNWSESPPLPTHNLPPQPSQLSSINSFHARQQPEILHIPPWSYLKFISNKWSIKGNVCTVTYTSPSWGDLNHNYLLVLIMRLHLGILWELPKWNHRVTHSTGVNIIYRPQTCSNQVQIWLWPARYLDYKHGGRVQCADIIGDVTCLQTSERPGSDECWLAVKHFMAMVARGVGHSGS